MELNEVLQARRSVRKFTEEAVSREDIDALMHAAMSGPSACNLCPWRFYVVTNKEKIAELRGASRFTKIKAPLAIVVCGDTKRTLPFGLGDFWVQDCSAATENILLRAVDLGLGAVWCGIHPQKGAVENVRNTLGLPEKHIPLNIIWLGHPAETPEPRDQYDEKNVFFAE
ncbi:MAG: nitroreductase family protein [Clostridia bacterium]|nr:nitroreductase family protein [Clostridia bacterium]